MAAAVDLEKPIAAKKRKRKCQRKLLLNQKVEARSLEDGFLGSWHSGTVVAYGIGVRSVKYDHLVLDNGFDNLTDNINVSNILEGIDSESVSSSHYRGHIRPTPPPIEFGKWMLSFGLCVDAYYQEAWWEGVIFDHEDGLEERRIFFPDLGDELNIGIEALRITQDWDEATENWQQRGTWSFLELIEQYEQEWYLAVSVKQIWYDVREKKGFEKIREWTSKEKNLWKELMMEVISENFNIIVKEMLQVLENSGAWLSESLVSIELAEPAVDSNMITELDFVETHALIPLRYSSDDELNNQNFRSKSMLGSSIIVGEEAPDFSVSAAELIPTSPKSDIFYPIQEKFITDNESNVKQLADCSLFSSNQTLSDSVLPQSVIQFTSRSDGFYAANSTAHQALSITEFERINKSSKSPSGRKTINWQPASEKFLSQAECCPGAITEYIFASEKKKRPTLREAVRKHLCYLGWKIECGQGENQFRVRYISPDGKSCKSLLMACQHLIELTKETLPLIPQTGKRCVDVSFSSQSSCLAGEQREKNLDHGSSPWQPLAYSHEDFIKPEYCPQAVINYYRHGSCKERKKNVSDMRQNARKHLLSMGWDLRHIKKGKRHEWCYISPTGRSFYSLQTACKISMSEEGGCENSSACFRPTGRTFACKEGEDQLTGEKLPSAARNLDLQKKWVPHTLHFRKFACKPQPKKLVKFSKGKFEVINNLRRRKRRVYKSCGVQNLRNSHVKKNGIGFISDKYIRRKKYQYVTQPKLTRGKLPIPLTTSCHDVTYRKSRHVLRSSKRVQQVSKSSHSRHNSRTILSWLIDNAIVLPRAKVQYYSNKDHQLLAEGQISSDGIRCYCCQKIFSLDSFKVHAGSSDHRPAASIFLEDGRSLLDCQKELLLERRRSLKEESLRRKKVVWHKGENDYICTICHFGGELLLCDKCPSSFHKSCLHLKEVPEGDWFCPSCCCAICHMSKFNKDLDDLDDCLLTCYQCEHKYHTECLRIRGVLNFGNYSENSWFCSKKCAKIYFALERLLGKQIPVGSDNLTWSILRVEKFDSDYFDPSRVEDWAENYSKLNVALGVMHECFEPVKEPLTKRDLVEDVIFSRRSELNRLNFQGFYTVLLERKDELISVANVRIYGEKVAEVPLVGTRFQYRRLGMCRILMNELEKKLQELGVERLVLPAIPSVLNTWTSAFGFSQMTDSERSEFLDCTFLDFQGTIMCHKFLLKIPTVQSEPKLALNDDFCKTGDDMDVDDTSGTSEVCQAEDAKESIMVGCGRPMNLSAGNNSGGNDDLVTVLMNPHNQLECKIGNVDENCSKTLAGRPGVTEFCGFLKYYKRRRKLVIQS